MRILVMLFFLVFLPTSVYSQAPIKSLNQVNQKVCNRFEEDVSKLAGIMEEVRERKGITETRVAFGGVDTQIEAADYQITYVAEAVAYQRAQKFSSKSQLKSSLETLRNKILTAKNAVGKALDYEKQ